MNIEEYLPPMGEREILTSQMQFRYYQIKPIDDYHQTVEIKLIFLVCGRPLAAETNCSVFCSQHPQWEHTNPHSPLIFFIVGILE